MLNVEIQILFVRGLARVPINNTDEPLVMILWQHFKGNPQNAPLKLLNICMKRVG
jgi:hypothetical protein